MGVRSYLPSANESGPPSMRRPPPHVEHAVGAAPLVDDDEPAVVGQRLLARRCGVLRRGRDLHAVEVHALVFGAELEPEAERLVVAAGFRLLALDLLAVEIGDG